MKGNLLTFAALLLTGCSASNGRLSHQQFGSYSTEFREVDDIAYLPLWIPAIRSQCRQIYHHPVSGLQIEKVEADGILVEGSIWDVDFDDFDLSDIEAQHPWHGYQLVMWPTENDSAYRLIYVSRMEEEDFDLGQYQIPKTASRITIRYRPRYPLDELGDLLVACAVRNEFSP